MNVMLPTRRMTVEEFFAWGEEHPDLRRCELIDGMVVVQQSEQWQNTQTKFALALCFVEAITRARIPYYAAPSGPAVRIGVDTAFEPDVIVAALPYPDARSYVVPNPFIVVEVLSPSTRRTDLVRKRAGYFSLETIRHYLVVDPEAKSVVHLEKTEAGIVESTATSGALILSPPGLTIDLADVFK